MQGPSLTPVDNQGADWERLRLSWSSVAGKRSQSFKVLPAIDRLKVRSLGGGSANL